MRATESIYQSCPADRQKIPRFLLLLSFVKLWERFSYYGMRGLLVLYFVSTLGVSDTYAYGVYALFIGIGYCTPPLFGFLADRFFGTRFMIKLGAIVLVIGHGMMGFSNTVDGLTFFGLAAIAIGMGAFKGNISNLLGACYPHNSETRSKGFSIFYTAVNLGRFLASIICSAIASVYGFHWGFALAGVAMVICLATFVSLEHLLPRDALPAKASFLSFRMALLFIVLLSVWLIGMALKNPQYFTNIMNIVGLMFLLIYFYVMHNAKSEDKKKLFVIACLCVVFCAFFGLEIHLGSLINLFTERNLDRTVFGYEIPAASLQSIMPLWIMIASACIAVYCPLNPRYINRFLVWGLFTTTLCFSVLYLGCLNADADNKVALWYLVAAIGMMSLGEVIIGPLIQSQVSWLAPEKHKGFVFGILMLSLAFASTLGGSVVKLMAIPKLESQTIDLAVSLNIYREGFKNIAIYNTVITAILACLASVKYSSLKTSFAKTKPTT